MSRRSISTYRFMEIESVMAFLLCREISLQKSIICLARIKPRIVNNRTTDALDGIQWWTCSRILHYFVTHAFLKIQHRCSLLFVSVILNFFSFFLFRNFLPSLYYAHFSYWSDSQTRQMLHTECDAISRRSLVDITFLSTWITLFKNF